MKKMSLILSLILIPTFCICKNLEWKKIMPKIPLLSIFTGNGYTEFIGINNAGCIGMEINSCGISIYLSESQVNALKKFIDDSF